MIDKKNQPGIQLLLVLIFGLFDENFLFGGGGVAAGPFLVFWLSSQLNPSNDVEQNPT